MELLYILLIIIFFGIIEKYLHQKNRGKIPLIIHVNGIRGKSTTTRMIASGLRNCGYKVWAKTTGSQPRFIYENGEEKKLKRRGSPRIKEQLKVIKKAARASVDVLVLECMALTPEIEYTAGQEIIKPDYSIITNIYRDHEEVMGNNLADICDNLLLSVPDSAKLITTGGIYRKYLKGRSFDFKVIKTEITETDEVMAEKFSYPNFADNVVLSLKMGSILQVDREKFIEGIFQASPDPGVSGLLKLKKNSGTVIFINAFAANDETSTLKMWDKYKEEIKGKKVIAIFNFRPDRPVRTKKMLKLYNQVLYKSVYKLYLWASRFAVRTSTIKGNYEFLKSGMSPAEIIKYLIRKHNVEELYLLGFGNYKGNAEDFVEYMKKEGKRCNV
ncbi:MAG: poly-gamma-glutamate synthase PgsB [bacterium]